MLLIKIDIGKRVGQGCDQINGCHQTIKTHHYGPRNNSSHCYPICFSQRTMILGVIAEMKNSRKSKVICLSSVVETYLTYNECTIVKFFEF